MIKSSSLAPAAGGSARYAPRFIAIAMVLAVLSCKSGDGGTDINLTITPTSADLAPGETIQLTAVGSSNATWSSSNSSIASVVPQTGFVTAVSRGMATISAVAGGTIATATINVIAPAQIQVPPEVGFSAIEGSPDPGPQTVAVENLGDAAFQGLNVGEPQYTQGQPTGWLEATLSGTSLSLSVTRGSLAFGEYTASLPVSAANAINSPQSILVTFSVERRPSIEVPVATVELSATPGGTAVATLDVTNGGGGTITGLTTRVTGPGGPPTWLESSLAGTEVPTTLTVTANAGQLPLGNYGGLVHIESSQAGIATKVLNVSFTVTPFPTIQLSRNTVTFTAPFQGDAPPAQTVAITNGTGGALTDLGIGTISYGAGASGWLTAQVDPTTAPATLTLGVNQGQLAEGSYTATVPVTSPVASNSPQNVQVTMVVGPPPQITATPGSLTFGAASSVFQNGPLPTQQVISIGSTSSTIPGLSYEVMYSGSAGWLNVSWSNSDTETPATLQVRPNDTGLSRGVHNAIIRVTSDVPGVPHKDIPIVYMISNFDIDVYPLFVASNPGSFPRLPCTQCHGGFSDPTNAWGYLNANKGVLICKITGGAACPSSMLMPPASVDVISKWLNAGGHR